MSAEWIKMNINSVIKIIGLFYLILASYLIFLLRFNFSIEIFLLILIICIFTDLGGYFFGKFLKGPKLNKISPKKTYAGVLGSFILSLISAIVFINLSSFITFTSFNLDNLLMKKISLDKISILFILFVSLISQIGDLIISYFKRLAQIKDTGNLLPGHGGILDRVDGIIFAMPISYISLLF